MAKRLHGVEYGWHLFALFCVLHLGYRARLWYALFHAHTSPFGTFPNEHPAVQYIGCSGRDAELGALLALATVLALSVCATLRWRWLARAVRGLSLAVVWFAVALAATHHRVMFDIGTGIDQDAIFEFFGPMPMAEVAGWGTWDDVALALAPLPLLWLFTRMPRPLRRMRDAVLVVLMVITLYFRPATVEPPSLHRGIVRTPIHHIMLELAAVLQPAESRFSVTVAPSQAQSGVFGLQDPRLVGPAVVLPQPVSEWAQRQPEAPPLNVLVVVMESTGADYVFDTSRGNATPMPFLRSLARSGWQLRQHRSVANSSHRSLFSLFSGLYPMLDRRVFCLRGDVQLPSLASYLGDGYDRFLVTPGRLETFFPRSFFANSGLTEMAGFRELADVGEGHQINARDEVAVVDRFLERLGKANKPFMAVYYSFVPHFDYHDYGPESRILPDRKQTLHRYFNNLRLLDTQIARIVARLKELGEAERTLIVLTGDHGEAFNQHPNNLTHSRYSFEENLRVPAILQLPGVLMPREVTRATSHVDILPTMLDILGVPYETASMQGESLARRGARRLYTFAAGNEDTYTSISRQGIKLQISLRYDSCWAYDLERDPKESKKLSCDRWPVQLEALQVMRGHQARVLREKGVRH